MTFSSALLGGLLLILQNTQQDVPLLICASSDLLLRVLVKDRKKYENDLLDPNFRFLKAVVAMLNERVGQTQFKEVEQNPPKFNSDEPTQTVELDTEPTLCSCLQECFYRRAPREYSPRLYAHCVQYHTENQLL
jgi:hypothetical protein